MMTYKKSNWSTSGCSVIIEPGEEETLLEWRCPQKHAAVLHEYMLGYEGRYIQDPILQIPEIEISLAFERLTVSGHTFHLNPNRWTKHPFQTAVKLIAKNKSNQPRELWGTLKGEHFPTTQIDPTPVFETPAQPIKENIMTPDELSNSHDDMPKLVPTALGIVKDDNLPEYAAGDAAALSVDSRGRLLVAMDALTKDAEAQLVRINTMEAELASDLIREQAEIELQKQKVTNKHSRKLQKLGNKRRRIDSITEEALAKEDKQAKTVISSYRYEFLSTFIRWAALAGTAITLTYLLT